MFVLAIFSVFIPFLAVADQQLPREVPPSPQPPPPPIFHSQIGHSPFHYPMPPKENCRNKTLCLAKLNKFSKQCTKDRIALLTKRKLKTTDQCQKDGIDIEIRWQNLYAEKPLLVTRCLMKVVKKKAKSCPKLRRERQRKRRQTPIMDYDDFFGEYPLGYGPNDYPKSCEKRDEERTKCHSLYWCNQEFLCDLCIDKSEYHHRVTDLRIDQWIHEGMCPPQTYPMIHVLPDPNNGIEIPHADWQNQ